MQPGLTHKPAGNKFRNTHKQSPEIYKQTHKKCDITLSNDRWNHPFFLFLFSFKSFTKVCFLCTILKDLLFQKLSQLKIKPPFNHPRKIWAKAFDSYSSLQTLQVREQVGEAEHEMCCYANNTYLPLGMRWEAGTGISSLYTHALNHYEPEGEGGNKV